MNLLLQILPVVLWPMAAMVVALTVGTVARVYGAIALRRIAIPWDGEGPMRDCLVRILDLGTSDKQWVHVEWSPRGFYECVETGKRLHELRRGAMVTHYAPLPEVEL